MRRANSFTKLPLLLTLILVCSCKTVVGPLTPAPSISRFYPDTVLQGAYDTIIGKNFGYRSVELTASIGPALSEIRSVTDTMIVIRVPTIAHTDTLHIKRGEIWADASHALTVLEPWQIREQFTVPDTAPVGTLITVKGSEFFAAKDSLTLLLGDILVPIENVYPDRLTFRVPQNGYTGWLQVLNGSKVVFFDNFTVSRPFAWHTLSVRLAATFTNAEFKTEGWRNYSHDITSTSTYGPWIVSMSDSTSLQPEILVVTSTGYYLYLDHTDYQGTNIHTFQTSITWDTVHNTVSVGNTTVNWHNSIPLPSNVTLDSGFHERSMAAQATGSPDGTLRLVISTIRAVQDSYIDAAVSSRNVDHQGEHDMTTSTTGRGDSYGGTGTFEMVFTP